MFELPHMVACVSTNAHDSSGTSKSVRNDITCHRKGDDSVQPEKEKYSNDFLKLSQLPMFCEAIYRILKRFFELWDDFAECVNGCSVDF